MLSMVKAWKLGRLVLPALVIMMTIGLLPAPGFSGTYTIYPTDSASVTIGETDYSISLWLGENQIGNSWYAYLKYDLSSIPATAKITGATLSAYCVQTIPDSGVVTQVYAVADNSWSRNTINWDNKPAYGALLDTTNATINTWSRWVIGKDNVLPIGQVSFMLMVPPPVGGGFIEGEFDSKGSPNEPYLVVTTTGGNEAAINLLLLSE